MNKKLPKVFQNNIGDIKNNERVYHASNDNVVFDNSDVKDVIEQIFTSPNHVYKTPVVIKTKEGTYECDVIGRTTDSLITIDNQKIAINNIERTIMSF